MVYRTEKYLRLAKHLGLISAALVFGCLVYAASLVASGCTEKIVHVDLAVVLGNQVWPDGTLSQRLQARLDRAVELYRAGYFPLILVSGGIGKEGENEAEAMAKYLVSRGIDRRAVIEDSAGVNTRATAQNTRSLMNARALREVLIVSQYYHLPRCRLAFSQVGLTHCASAYARYFEMNDFWAIFREMVALPSYLIAR